MESKITDKLTHNIILKFFQVAFEALRNLMTFSPLLKPFPLNTLELNPPLQPHEKVSFMPDQHGFINRCNSLPMFFPLHETNNPPLLCQTKTYWSS